VKSQCVAFDGNGVLVNDPVWLSCFGTDYTLTFQSTSTFGAYTIDWGDGSPIENGTGLTPPQNLQHIYTSAVNTFTVTFTETNTGCQIVGTVVMEEPTTASIQIPFGGITQTCAPAPLEFINSSTNVSTTTVFTWDFGDGTPPLVLDYTNAGDTVTHNYLQGTVDCETQVELIAENQCNTAQGGPSTATFNPIRIWDLDEAAIDASDVLLCFPETEVTFTNITDRNCLNQGNTFQRQEYWNFGDYWGLGYDSIIPWTPWPPTFPYTIDYPGLGTYDVMMIDSNFCGQDTAYIQIQIVPPPTAGFTLASDTVCANTLALFTNTSTGGANVYSWNFGDGTGWQNINGNPSHAYIAPGDYTIQLAASIAGANGCTDTVTDQIHILPVPQANFVLDNNIGCDSLTVNYTDASINAVQWDWIFGNGNTFSGQTPPSQFYASDGVYTAELTVTALNGCTDTETRNIEVFLSPTVAFSPQSICANVLANFTDESTSSIGDPIVTWNWDFDNGDFSNIQHPTTAYITDGTYNIALSVATANCSNSDTLPIVVEPLPVASFTQDTSAGCSTLPVNFNNSSTGANNFLWDFGDGDTSILNSPSHNYVNNGTNDIILPIQLIAFTGFGCTDTAYSTIEIYHSVASDFVHDGIPGCAPLDVNFTNNSSPGHIYEWDFGDGNLDSNYNTAHQYINSTLFINNYNVQLTVVSANGCADTSSQVITVYPMPDFTFSSVPDSGCSPLTVNFPTVVGAVAYDWDFGDGTTASGVSPSHTYFNSTTNDVIYQVQLVATSPFGCLDTNYGTVKVFPNPTAQFLPIVPSGCAPLEVNFQNSSIGGVSFEWLYGDGNDSDTAAAVHDYVYQNTTNSDLNINPTLVVTSQEGCTDSASRNIVIHPEVIASFDSDTAGCTPLHAFFTNNSINADSYVWDFDNGFTDNSANPNEFFFNPGNADSIYTVQLIARSLNGCSDTAYQDILVYPIPNALFTPTPTSQLFPSTNVSVNNASTLGSWEYLWNWGDGTLDSIYSPSDHSYSTWGDFDIELIVQSPFCSDTMVQTITVIPPLPEPVVYGSGEGCRPVTIQFTDSSQYVDSYYWDFGDGGFSTQAEPYYTYHQAGDYTITLTTTGPGGTTTLVIQDSVQVYEYANAFFQHTPTQVYVPFDPVQFFNLSSFSDSYIWDFGDGQTSTDEDPQHFYLDSGYYDVTLIANNQFNCPDTFSVPQAVLAETGGEIVFPNAFTPDPNGPTSGFYDPNSFDNDVFFPVFRGVEEYELSIFNRWGELIFESFDINIGWDGYYRDQLVQQDVYVWKAKVKFTNGSEKVFVGEVHLIR